MTTNTHALETALLNIQSADDFLTILSSIEPSRRAGLQFSEFPNAQKTFLSLCADKGYRKEGEDVLFFKTIESLIPHARELFEPSLANLFILRGSSTALIDELFYRSKHQFNKDTAKSFVFEILNNSRRSSGLVGSEEHLLRLVLNHAKPNLNQPVTLSEAHGIFKETDHSFFKIQVIDGQKTLLSHLLLSEESQENVPLFLPLMANKKKTLQLLKEFGASLNTTFTNKEGKQAKIGEYFVFKHQRHFKDTHTRAEFMKEVQQQMGKQSQFEDFLAILANPEHVSDLEIILQQSNQQWIDWKTPQGVGVLHLLALLHPQCLTRVLAENRALITQEKALSLADHDGKTVSDYLAVAKPDTSYGKKAQEKFLEKYTISDKVKSDEYQKRALEYTRLILKNHLEHAIDKSPKKQYHYYQHSRIGGKTSIVNVYNELLQTLQREDDSKISPDDALRCLDFMLKKTISHYSSFDYSFKNSPALAELQQLFHAVVKFKVQPQNQELLEKTILCGGLLLFRMGVIDNDLLPRGFSSQKITNTSDLYDFMDKTYSSRHQDYDDLKDFLQYHLLKTLANETAGQSTSVKGQRRTL